ncbi:uncharacterized protein PHACADRAFT_29229 [Phanerochaete carnosa HHB-10118-sp]|uniref:Uncharacterized protein n=1 Tax=Phanerochaete carnosa (strain HHB-10118-sp) TaxID=650164 RepID=K5UVA7_PHACS|nr:uncharacterized protein PHACADRAFT_29229 [Phanerochaete carnosa HHB-10118-sp]EKM53936.1 hypothetical protein PHACADRAFT_29229 [Phanerochaete carnosa HHB-10118-sp]
MTSTLKELGDSMQTKSNLGVISSANVVASALHDVRLCALSNVHSHLLARCKVYLKSHYTPAQVASFASNQEASFHKLFTQRDTRLSIFFGSSDMISMFSGLHSTICDIANYMDIVCMALTGAFAAAEAAMTSDNHIPFTTGLLATGVIAEQVYEVIAQVLIDNDFEILTEGGFGARQPLWKRISSVSKDGRRSLSPSTGAPAPSRDWSAVTVATVEILDETPAPAKEGGDGTAERSHASSASPRVTRSQTEKIQSARTTSVTRSAAPSPSSQDLQPTTKSKGKVPRETTRSPTANGVEKAPTTSIASRETVVRGGRLLVRHVAAGVCEDVSAAGGRCSVSSALWIWQSLHVI